MSSDLIPVPRQDLEAAVSRLTEKAMRSPSNIEAALPIRLRDLLAHPPSGTWLSAGSPEIAALRKWRHGGAWFASGEGDNIPMDSGRAAKAIDDILAACPEPEQFSDEECDALAQALYPAMVKGSITAGSPNSILWGRGLLTRLAAAGLIVTEAPT